MTISSEFEYKHVDFNRLDIYETEFWSIQLHYNQSYLGRCVIVCKRDTQSSFIHTSLEEYMDLRHLIARFEVVLTSIFNPDRYNYTQLGNEWPQLHLHAIPRYSGTRSWNNRIIRDMRWGKNPTPKPNPPIPLDEVYLLALELKEQFNIIDIENVHGIKEQQVHLRKTK